MNSAVSVQPQQCACMCGCGAAVACSAPPAGAQKPQPAHSQAHPGRLKHEAVTYSKAPPLLSTSSRHFHLRCWLQRPATEASRSHHRLESKKSISRFPSASPASHRPPLLRPMHDRSEQQRHTCTHDTHLGTHAHKRSTQCCLHKTPNGPGAAPVAVPAAQCATPEDAVQPHA
jgi:hypothetical protein